VVDNDLIGIGANKFAELKNNKALEEFFGAEEWNKITEAKELQLAELMIDSNIDLNPTKVVKNRDLLVAAVGTDKADYYTDKAKNTLNAKMKDLDADRTWEEIKDNNTKIEIFTDMLLRVNAFKKDPTLKNEAPTAAMLFDAYNDQMINKSMLNMLTNTLIDGDAQTDSEITGAITSAFYSAGSIEMLEDIKRAVF